MRVALLHLLVSLITLSPSLPQSSFSPFSLLGSFFRSGSIPSRPRQRALPPRQRPRQRPQLGPRIILRPNVGMGPSISTPNFSASQPVPLRIKLEENNTVRPTKSTWSKPSKASHGLVDLSPTSGLANITGKDLTKLLQVVEPTNQAFTNPTKIPDITNHPDIFETTVFVTNQPNSTTVKEDINSIIISDVVIPIEVEEGKKAEPSAPIIQAYPNQQRDDTLVSGSNIDTTFSLENEDLGKDNYYDDLVAPKPINTYYISQTLNYNQDSFILEDTINQNISDNNIVGTKSLNHQDTRFQIYPRGNIGSYRNEPIIISQIPVKSLQTSNKLINKLMPPTPSSIFSLPISQHSSKKKIHVVLSKQKMILLESKHFQNSVKALKGFSTLKPFIDSTTFISFIDDTTLNPFKEASSINKKKKIQQVFETGVLPTPQQQQQFDFPRITEKLARKVQFKTSDYTGSHNKVKDLFRGVIIGSEGLGDGEQGKNINLEQLVDCGAGSDVGFCAMSASYPGSTIQELIKNCQLIIQSFVAVVPEDLEELGDNSSVFVPDGDEGNNQQDNSKPWSWKAYSYKKRQICDSELYFIKPGFARDTKGDWKLIVQTEEIQQRVVIDMCHSPGSPCPGVADCGTKSRCVQRYNYQLLLVIEINTTDSPPDQPGLPVCPTIRAFKFPTSCICHVETHHNPHNKREHNTFFNKLTK